MYTTIIHPLRVALGLSVNEYCVLDTIYRLSNNVKYSGWCIQSKEKIGEGLDLSVRNVYRILKTLEQKGLVARKKNGHIRSTDAFNEPMANKDKWLLGFAGKEQEFLSGKHEIFEQLMAKDRLQVNHDKMSVEIMTKCQSDTDKMSYNNKNTIRVNNNNTKVLEPTVDEQSSSPSAQDPVENPSFSECLENTKEISSVNTKVIQEEKKSYGNQDINDMLAALKAVIGIDDFADSQKWQRIYAKHCLNLVKKIGRDEFRRRLQIILGDEFKRQNSNKIKYLYGQIKGFVEPQRKSNSLNLDAL